MQCSAARAALSIALCGLAADKKLSYNNDWSYVCCMITKDSSCYEKHR